MKIGTLIIFYNNEKEINNKALNSLSSIPKQSIVCLINNGSNDTTLEKLMALKEITHNLHIIDIKKNKGIQAAIKSGTRYIQSQFNIKHIGYINFEKITNTNKLGYIIKFVNLNKELIIKICSINQEEKKEQRALIKNTFSIIDYLNILEINNNNIVTPNI